MKRWCRKRTPTETETVLRDDSPGAAWCEVVGEFGQEEHYFLEIMDGVAKRVPFVEGAPAAAPQTGQRAFLAAALPDILLAVADGADLRDELKKILSKVEVPDGER